MTQVSAFSSMSGNDQAIAALSLQSISKAYPGVRALNEVSLSFVAGEVHGLVGENGAGKSTLMGVASGSVVPDSGLLTINGESNSGGDPGWARERGLAIAHQEPALLPDLTVAENMRLVTPRRLRPAIRRQNEWARDQLASWDSVSKIAPDVMAARLRPDERFIVELARALAAQPKILILDEPTEHLLDAGVRVLFEQIRECVRRGIAVVYISHRIREVMEVADVVSVLRNGELRGTVLKKDLTEDGLVNLIVGRQLGARFPEKAAQGTRAAMLSVSGLTGTTFSEVSFTLHKGEIVGLAGIEGQGQREVLRAIAGLERATGETRIGGQSVHYRTATGAVAKGVAYLTNDRHHEGILSGLTVRENLVLRALRTLTRFGVIRRHEEKIRASEGIEAFGVRTPSQDRDISTLSGGNQQKVMIGRVLLSDASILLIDEPSQGVDVGARADIYGLLRGATQKGKAICVLSSDNSELEGLCDRVLVFSRGQIVQELEGEDVVEHEITQAAVTATGTRSRHERPAIRGGFARRVAARAVPWLVLIAAIVGLGLVAAATNEFYFTVRNMSLVLPMLGVIVLAGIGQQFSMLVGGIDLSIGPLMSTVIVTASFVIAPDVMPVGLIFGLFILLGVAVTVGIVNWTLVFIFKITPIIATLVTYTALLGVALIIRPTPGGAFHKDVLGVMEASIGFVPLTVVVSVVLAIGLEYALTNTPYGVKLRAAGSNPKVAAVVGIEVPAMNLVAYVGASFFGFLAALVFLPVSGSGNASVGTIYTLSSIAAVVLGGASIFGGRGSFIGALLGGATVLQINTVVPFLGITAYWQQYLLGGLTIAATAAYSRIGSGAGRRSK